MFKVGDVIIGTSKAKYTGKGSVSKVVSINDTYGEGRILICLTKSHGYESEVGHEFWVDPTRFVMHNPKAARKSNLPSWF